MLSCALIKICPPVVLQKDVRLLFASARKIFEQGEFSQPNRQNQTEVTDDKVPFPPVCGNFLIVIQRINRGLFNLFCILNKTMSPPAFFVSARTLIVENMRPSPTIQVSRKSLEMHRIPV